MLPSARQFATAMLLFAVVAAPVAETLSERTLKDIVARQNNTCPITK